MKRLLKVLVALGAVTWFGAMAATTNAEHYDRGRGSGYGYRAGYGGYGHGGYGHGGYGHGGYGHGGYGHGGYGHGGYGHGHTGYPGHGGYYPRPCDRGYGHPYHRGYYAPRSYISLGFGF